MLPLPGGITVTVQRPTFDRFNDATYSDHHTISGCVEYPNESPEVGPAVWDNRALLVPPGSDIQHTDRVVMGGVVYQVNGQPKEWVDPVSGWNPGTQAYLTRVT